MLWGKFEISQTSKWKSWVIARVFVIVLWALVHAFRSALESWKLRSEQFIYLFISIWWLIECMNGRSESKSHCRVYTSSVSHCIWTWNNVLKNCDTYRVLSILIKFSIKQEHQIKNRFLKTKKYIRFRIMNIRTHSSQKLSSITAKASTNWG